jgi:hypothetical protein
MHNLGHSSNTYQERQSREQNLEAAIQDICKKADDQSYSPEEEAKEANIDVSDASAHNTALASMPGCNSGIFCRQMNSPRLKKALISQASK